MTGPSFSFGNGFPTAKTAAQATAQPAAASGDDVVKETTTRDFMKDVMDASQTALVLVDFWAEWCGPCKQLTPVIEKVVRSYGGKVKLVKMNIDRHPEVAGQLGVRSIPAVFAFQGGQPIDGFMGAVPESQIKTFIDKNLGAAGPGDGVADLVAHADEALVAGDLATAAQAYGAVLQVEPENVAAIGGMAEVLVTAGEIGEAEQLLASAPAAALKDPRILGVKARIALAEQTAKLGDPVALEARLATDPSDHQARFDLALIFAARGEHQAAVDSLIEIIRRDRTWTDDGARKQLLQFFEAWGPKDPMTLYGRRRLSSVLFS